MSRTLLRGGTIVSSDDLAASDVLIENGVIIQLGVDLSSSLNDATVIEAQGLLLFPGLIDCHVHFREPGFLHKATMASESVSARFGGVTTVCEMPNTDPPTVTIAALRDKVRRAEMISGIDIRFFFGVTQQTHLHALIELWTGRSPELASLQERCCGVKIFLDHSTGSQKIDDALISDVFAACAQYQIPLVAHCEDPLINQEAARRTSRTDIAAHSLLRPVSSEEASVRCAIDHARMSGAALHIAHVSTAHAVELVRSAKKEGLSVTCEATPHHLFLTVDDYDTLGTLGKMNPPLRTMDHRDALWAGIADGTVDCIATDHAPHTLGEKQCALPLHAPSGVPGVETLFPLLLSVAAGRFPHGVAPSSAASFTYPSIVRLCLDRPSSIFRLRKQSIVEGAVTSIILVDPREQWELSRASLHSKCDWTPYEGWKVVGKIRTVL